MGQALRFVLVLVVGLAVLAWAAWRVVDQTTQAWFERDIVLRAQLAVHGSRSALLAQWGTKDALAVRGVLNEITRDERILAAAACNREGLTLGVTDAYPGGFPCAELVRHLQVPESGETALWQTWATSVDLPDGRIHISAVPLSDGTDTVGFVVLIHDMSFLVRREDKVRQLVLISFAVLAVAASLMTLIAARLFWRGWTREIRRFLRGGPQRRAFLPILGDVRELIARISLERALDNDGGAWTPARLKQTLTQHLHGEKIIIVANREPYIHVRGPDGAIHVQHPASGLVTALEPVLRACSGVWIAHGSGSADRDTADADGRLRVPPGEEAYVLRRLWLTPEEEKGYYYGFANEGLWPLCHVAHTRPSFRSADWKLYQVVNRKFADAVCAEADSEDPVILVQDYHFALAPRLIRERLPRSTVLAFWHVPWPNAERVGICPWREELLQGMLGGSILGFHTQSHCNNFLDSVDRYLEARIDREQIGVVHQGRTTLVRAYPISIEWPTRWAANAPSPQECRAAVFAELKLAPGARLGLGVDRLDYTKGVEERLWAVERLLERFPQWIGKFSFVQLAAPSRVEIERYRQLNESVEAAAARINERFGSAGYRPVILFRAHHEPPAVFRYYRAADLCYVSSLHDGMNLVAKEFVAAREDEQGVLCLSHFAGASRELTEALIVNPYDLEEASSALHAALSMPAEEQRDRMRAMRALLAEFNVYRWAGRMLRDAARLRWHDRLTGRLTEWRPPVGAALR